MMAKFRFEDLEIWQTAIAIADSLFDIAGELVRKILYRFADQLRGAGMSMSNYIAAGSGSRSNKVFIRYLEYARNSTFENANIVILLNRRGLITEEHKFLLNEELDKLSRKISTFQKSLAR